MNELPKEILNIISDYKREFTDSPIPVKAHTLGWFEEDPLVSSGLRRYIDPKEEKATLPYLFREDLMEQLPKEIRKTISDYTTPVDYQSLVILAKLGKLPNLTEEEVDIISEPWSDVKIARALKRERLYPILREAISLGIVTDGRVLFYIFDKAVDNKDYPTALLTAERYPFALGPEHLRNWLYRIKTKLEKVNELRFYWEKKDAKTLALEKEILAEYRPKIEFLIDHHIANAETSAQYAVPLTEQITNILNSIGWDDLSIKFLTNYQN